jgi:hypothetical protein
LIDEGNEKFPFIIQQAYSLLRLVPTMKLSSPKNVQELVLLMLQLNKRNNDTIENKMNVWASLILLLKNSIGDCLTSENVNDVIEALSEYVFMGIENFLFQLRTKNEYCNDNSLKIMIFFIQRLGATGSLLKEKITKPRFMTILISLASVLGYFQFILSNDSSACQSDVVRDGMLKSLEVMKKTMKQNIISTSVYRSNFEYYNSNADLIIVELTAYQTSSYEFRNQVEHIVQSRCCVDKDKIVQDILVLLGLISFMLSELEALTLSLTHEVVTNDPRICDIFFDCIFLYIDSVVIVLSRYYFLNTLLDDQWSMRWLMQLIQIICDLLAFEGPSNTREGYAHQLQVRSH